MVGDGAEDPNSRGGEAGNLGPVRGLGERSGSGLAAEDRCGDR